MLAMSTGLFVVPRESLALRAHDVAERYTEAENFY
jgi:hypothetical protein